jgi:hypothetical protein
MFEFKVGQAEQGMEWLDFIAAMTGSLAWPLAAVAIAMVFRSQIRTLIGRISEIGYGDAKATFARELDSAERKAEALPVALGEFVDASEARKGLEDEAVPESEDNPPDVLDAGAIAKAHMRNVLDHYGVESGRFAMLLDISPSAAVIDTWKSVERILARLAKRKQLVDSHGDVSGRRLIQRLLAEKYIEPEVADLALQLQKMRNDAVHGDDQSVTVADAIRFREIANQVTLALRRAMHAAM